MPDSCSGGKMAIKNNRSEKKTDKKCSFAHLYYDPNCVRSYRNVHKVQFDHIELDAFYQSTIFENDGVQK